MHKVSLGASGLCVSQLCFGTLTMGPLQRGFSPEAGADLIIYARERGIDFVDTAEIYGTYPHIALAIAEIPDLRVSTKCYAYDEETAEHSFKAAMVGIGREYIDLFMLHEQESIHTLRGHEKALEYFHKRKEQGYIGAVGISTHYVDAVRAATGFNGVEVIHNLLNIDGFGIADGTRFDMENACQTAYEAGIGIFSMKPFGGGHLIKKRREAIAYLQKLPYIAAIAVGMQSKTEIDYNIALVEGRDPGDDLEAAINQMPRELIIHDWCEGCGRCVTRCTQKAMSLREGKAIVDVKRCVMCGYCASVCPQFCIKII